jgi:DNA-binding NarL/FixJ family response regulator
MDQLGWNQRIDIDSPLDVAVVDDSSEAIRPKVRAHHAFQGCLGWVTGWHAVGAGLTLAIRMKTLLIVEDDRLLREALVRSAQTGDASPAAWRVLAANSLAAARSLLKGHRLDAVFLDLGLPDGDGVGLIGDIKAHHPTCEVLVITVFADEQRVIRSLEAGASGYLVKSDLPNHMDRLIQTIEAGGSPVSPAIARRLIERLQTASPPATHEADAERLLSTREAEVLLLCAKGLRYAEVAATLGLSIHTVNAHLKSVYRKLMVNSRAEAVYEARKSGLLRE